jgi:neutral ceramidase
MKTKKRTIWIFAFIVVLLMFNSLVNIHARPGSNKDKGLAIGKVFKAGAATANITPPLGLGIVGGWGAPEATHVHDELHARCLVLCDGEKKLVFIIVDNIGMKRDLIDKTKAVIQEETNIPRANVLISATHTHSSVSSGGEGSYRKELSSGASFDNYQEFLTRRIADVARIAINNLEPAQIGWGGGNVPEHVFVRRYKMKPGTPMPNPFGGQDKVVMNPGHSPNVIDHSGKNDPEVAFISVKSIEGKPIALLANYSLHYVGNVPQGHISADYFAVFADRIQELLKADRQDPPFVGIMSNGTSGNINNNNYLKPSIKKEPFEQIKLVAEDVARAVFRAHNSIEYHDWVPLGAAEEELTLKVRKPSAEMLKRAKWVISRPDTVQPVHIREVTYAHRIIQHNEIWPDYIDVVLQVFRIGDLGVAAIPFEVFSEAGLEIKAKSPFQKSFTISFANGSYGYLPRPEDHELGGYETWLPTNKVEVEASRKIVAKLLDLFAKLK